MKRRSFLASTMAVGALVALPASRSLAGGGVLSTAVVVTGISADSDPVSLLAFARQLVEQGVWVTCAIRTTSDRDDAPRLTSLLLALQNIGSGIDIAIELPDLASRSPYFQARAVYDARETLQRLFGAETPIAPPQSVLCNEIENPSEPIGVRASGIRNVLTLPQTDTSVTTETWSDGVVRFLGGQRIGPQRDFSFRASEAGAEHALIYYVSAGDLPTVTKDRLRAWSAGLAETLLTRELNGQLALMTVADFQLRDDFSARRLVTLLFDLPETAPSAERDAVAAFRQELAKRHIPSAIRPSGDVFWVERSTTDQPLVPVTVGCDSQTPSQIVASSPVGPGYVMRLSGDARQVPGIDGCVILEQPAMRLDPNAATTSVANPLAQEQDIVLILSAGQMATQEAQRRVFGDLQALSEDGITQFVSIGEFAAALHSNEPVAVRHRLTRAAIANAPFESCPKTDDAERARLLDDARHAWGYFQTYQEAATGLCPATVDSRPGGDIQRSVTMWDVGSNLNAIVAAVELDLIDRKQAEKTFERIFPNIMGRSTDGRLLPQGWIRTDRHKWGIRDFDGCDGGRLLASLDNMRRRFGMGDEIAKLVKSWDLDKIVVDGEIQSVISRKFASTFNSHCAHYAALGFRRWGLNPSSPYETFENRPPGDGEMALLETVARIGPLGTEPLLLEAMELGMSPESTYLAEILVSAMEEEFKENNRLICPSETPMDSEPWFIYQGLELGSGSRSWRLDTVGHHPEYMTEAAAEELMTFSTKAAFLWAAYRPCAFTRKLLDYARKHGRDAVGFVSGVKVKAHRPTRNYTDLNSNAIILQAIAHMLRATD